MLYAINPALVSIAPSTPCLNAFWHSHPYISVHFFEMFYILVIHYNCIEILLPSLFCHTLAPPDPSNCSRYVHCHINFCQCLASSMYGSPSSICKAIIVEGIIDHSGELVECCYLYITNCIEFLLSSLLCYTLAPPDPPILAGKFTIAYFVNV